MAGSTLLLIGGLVLLVPAADHFVLGAARTALLLRLSPVLVGAVIVGFGTSAPEILITVLAALDGRGDVAAGNLVGSNIANVGLVLGVGALVAPIAITSRALRIEMPLSVAGVVMFALFLQGGLSRVEGAIMVAAIVVAGFIVVRTSSRAEADVLGDEVTEEEEAEGHDPRAEAARAIAGLVGTLVGAHLVVRGAVGVADGLDISEGFVGLTVVAVGTSLPELVTAIHAARRGHPDLVVGNILGSNLFNALAAGGLLALLAPGPVADPAIAGLAAAAMVAATAGAWLFFATGRRLVRWEGAVLLAAYAALLPLLA